MKTLKTLLAALAVVVCGSMNAMTNDKDASTVEYSGLITDINCYETVSFINSRLKSENTKNHFKLNIKYLFKKYDESKAVIQFGRYKGTNGLYCTIQNVSDKVQFDERHAFGNLMFKVKTEIDSVTLRTLKCHEPVELSLEKGTLIVNHKQSKL